MTKSTSSVISKVVQFETVRAADEGLAFDAEVFSDEVALGSFLEKNRDTTKVLRPEFSASTGSALFSRPEEPVPPDELAGLWRGGGRVVVHEYVPGTPYLANGVVVDGELRLTDTWRCFTLESGPRRLLTSVVNVPPSSIEVGMMEQALQALITDGTVRDGPVCFEVVLGEERTKVVKFAQRVAGAPLPGLCHILGIAGQSGKSAQEPDGFVADYAFTVQRSGRLVGFTVLDEVRSLASYSRDLFIPAVGDPVTETVGEGGGAAVLLRHADEATLLKDVELLQEHNRVGFFVVAD